MTLCEKLIDLRRKAGLSQEQMAQQLDVSRQAVSKWETGSSPSATRCLWVRSSYRNQRRNLYRRFSADISQENP